jgi:hypothetical protein
MSDMKRTSLYSLFGLVLMSACGRASDIEIRNPLAAGAVDANRVVKEHNFAERERGLPAGTMADEATLMSLDDKQICFGLQLHELDPIDLAQVEARLMTPKLERAAGEGQVWPEPPTSRTYNGLIPQRQITGSETYCAQYQGNYCVAWRTRPVYSVVYIPGPVNVYTTRGRLCFPNGGLADAGTEQVSLELKMARQGWEHQRMGGWGAFSGNTKKVVFRWGFLVAKNK